MTAALAYAVEYVERGWSPVPIPHGEKGPRLKSWQELRITRETVPRYFNGARLNIGVILGQASHDLVDTDLDTVEAIALASFYLPPTDSVFGRASKPGSHRLYVSPSLSRELFNDPEDGELLLELRGTGHQTVFPGSVHPSGEPVEWQDDGDPAPVDPGRLRGAAARLAAATMLLRAAPAKGRHDLLWLVANALCRGLGADATKAFLRPLAKVLLADRERDAKGEVGRLVDRAAALLGEGKPVSGWPKLAEAIGAKRAAKLAEWLGIEREPDDRRNLFSQSGQPERSPQPVDARLFSLNSLFSQCGSEQWPEPLGEAAFIGLAGEVVRTIEPHTEADPAGLLLQFLAAFGNAVGRGPYFQVEGDRHATNIFAGLVGETAKGRKGTAWGRIRQLFDMAEPTWAGTRVLSGLASGEGLIWQVRDPIVRQVRNKKTKEMEEEVVDEGVHDKRLLVQEPELARVLRVMARDGNTLSAIIRDAWDKGNLRALTKNSPAVATGALISIVGHITADELRQELTRTDAANGFANRFLLACVRRSKFLPDGGGQVDLGPLAERLADAIGVASRIAQVCRSAEARALWHRVYEKLSEGRPGLVGAVTGRAEAQVLRLSLLYALLDKSPFIEKRHLEAALELYRFLQQSAEFVFGDSLGDHVADTILVSLRTNPDGLTASEVSALFGRHEDAARIQVARDMLVRRGLVRVERVPTAGRAKVVLKVVVPALDCEKSEFSEKSVTSMAYGPPQAVQECEKRVLDAADEPEGFDL